MSLHVQPIAGVGAEIQGVDLSRELTNAETWPVVSAENGLHRELGEESVFDHDARTAELVEELSQRRILRDVDLEAFQRLGNRVLRGIRDRANAATILVLQRDGLQDVVDLRRPEAQLGRSVAVYGPRVLEIADAGGEQHDRGNGDVSIGPRRLRTRTRARREEDNQEQQSFSHRSLTRQGDRESLRSCGGFACAS